MKDYTTADQGKKLLELGLNSNTADLYLVGRIRDERGNRKEVVDWKIESLKPYSELEKKGVKGFETYEYLPAWTPLNLFKQLPKTVNGYTLRLEQDYIYYSNPGGQFLCYYPIVGDDFLTPILFMVEFLVTNNLAKL